MDDLPGQIPGVAATSQQPEQPAARGVDPVSHGGIDPSFEQGARPLVLGVPVDHGHGGQLAFGSCRQQLFSAGEQAHLMLLLSDRPLPPLHRLPSMRVDGTSDVQLV